MASKTTNLDLYLTAAACAVLNIGITEAFDLDAASNEAFVTAGHDKRDYPRWKTFFNERITAMRTMAGQAAQSNTDDAENARTAQAQADLEARKKPVPPVPMAPVAIKPLPRPIVPATRIEPEPPAPAEAPAANKPESET